MLLISPLSLSMSKAHGLGNACDSVNEREKGGNARQIRATSYLARSKSDVIPRSALHRITCYLAQICHGRMTFKS